MSSGTQLPNVEAGTLFPSQLRDRTKALTNKDRESEEALAASSTEEDQQKDSVTLGRTPDGTSNLSQR